MCTLIVSGGTWKTLTIGTMSSSLRFRRNCEYTWGSRLGAESTGYCSSSKENKQYLSQESGNGNRNEAEVYISKPSGVKKNSQVLALVQVLVRMLRLRQSLLLQLGKFAEVMSRWCSNRIEVVDFAREKETFIFEHVVLDMPTYLQAVGKQRD